MLLRREHRVYIRRQKCSWVQGPKPQGLRIQEVVPLERHTCRGLYTGTVLSGPLYQMKSGLICTRWCTVNPRSLNYSTPTSFSSQEASALYEQQEKLHASTSRIEQILDAMQQGANTSSNVIKSGSVPRELSVSYYFKLYVIIIPFSFVIYRLLCIMFLHR